MHIPETFISFGQWYLPPFGSIRSTPNTSRDRVIVTGKVNVTQLRFRHSAASQGRTKGALQVFAAKQSALIGYRLKLKFNTLLRAIRFPNDNPRHTARINHFLVKLCMHYIKEGNTLLTKERLPAGTPKIINDTILFKALSNTYCCRESKIYSLLC